jgi:outer membrane protein assembly factor BamB
VFDAGRAFAFNATSGATLWTWMLPNCCAGPSPSAAVVNGIVYFGPYTYNLYGLTAAGARVWNGATSGDGSFGTVAASAAVANGTAYAIGDNSLDVFDVATTNCYPNACAPRWTATIGSLGSDSSPAVANGVVYVGSYDHKLYAFDAAGYKGCSGTPKTCAPLWTASTGGAVESSPAVANGMVYVGSDDGKLHSYGLP